MGVLAALVGGHARGQETEAFEPEPPAEREIEDLLEGIEVRGTSEAGNGLLRRVLGIEESPVAVYGWIQNSFTGNPLDPPDGYNTSVFPNYLANSWEGNQYYLAIERPTTPGDGFQLGGRFDFFLGNDWIITKDYGLFDNAWPIGWFPGIDLPQMYLEAHFPVLAPRGLTVKGGRFYSPAGYESIMATQRPLFSVANSVNFTPFTFFGVQTTLHLSDRVQWINGAVNGWDRWINQTYRYNYLGGWIWNSKSGRSSIRVVGLVGPNQLPRYAPADTPILPLGVRTSEQVQGRTYRGYAEQWRSYLSAVVTHEWNDRLREAAEVYFVSELNAPLWGPNGTDADIGWRGFVHWFLYDVNERTTAVWRAEIFRDEAGTAYPEPDTYYEMTLGLKYVPKPWLWIRPEVRYDWAQFKRPYDGGTKGSQITISVDAVVLY